MAGASRNGETTARTEFELERLAVEDGRLIVEGRWHGVPGRRFVRPVLRMDGRRRLIAELDHKPWAPHDDEPWVAAFDLRGADPGPARLEVAPDICVDLPDPGASRATGERLLARDSGRARGVVRKGEVKAAAPERLERTDTAPELRAEREARDAATAEAGELRAELERVREDAKAESAELRAELDSARDELASSRRDGERARSETERLRDSLSEAREAVDALRGELDRTEAARGRALVEREEMRRELEDARRAPGRTLAAGPYLPTLREPARRSPSWGTRAGAAVALLVLLYALVWLVAAVT